MELCWLKAKVSAFRHLDAFSNHVMEAFRSLGCWNMVLPVSFSLLPDGRGTSEASEPCYNVVYPGRAASP